jgi:dTMP kinase
MKESGRGLLVALEGSEGTGKTTQAQLLLDRLRSTGLDAVMFREPGGTEIGDEIRSLLLDPERSPVPRTEALLFMASRAELCEREIRPALERGAVVILDRFFLSTYAYQIAGRGLAEEDIRAANRLATGELVPSLTLLLQLPLEEALARAAARGAPDRMESSGRQFHERVAAAFANFTDPVWLQLHPECGVIVPVDASGSQSAVTLRLEAAIAAHAPRIFSPVLESH